VFVDVKDKDFDSTIKYDESFFVLLNRVVQRASPGSSAIGR
jgi:hypothetical protein